jgi:hypothetical protein
MADETLASDFSGLPLPGGTGIEGSPATGLHDASADGSGPITGAAFHHPEKDAVGTTWEPDWQPMETYRDGEVVMLDDGDRQLLGRREMGMWMELTAGDELAQPDFQPMLWSNAPEQVKYDLL